MKGRTCTRAGAGEWEEGRTGSEEARAGSRTEGQVSQGAEERPVGSAGLSEV